MTALILCGPPGSGKSTFGKKAASNLSWSFIDTDQLITLHYGSPRKIYLEQGEAHLRAIEKKVIFSLEKKSSTLIALGGGSLNDPENVAFLQSIAPIIYLKTPVYILEKRHKERGAPSHLAPSILMKERESIYQTAATHIIDTEKLSSEAIIHHIMIIARSYGE